MDNKFVNRRFKILVSAGVTIIKRLNENVHVEVNSHLNKLKKTPMGNYSIFKHFVSKNVCVDACHPCVNNVGAVVKAFTSLVARRNKASRIYKHCTYVLLRK